MGISSTNFDLSNTKVSISGHLGSKILSLPFFWLRTLWLNFFSDSEKWLIFASEDIYRPWKVSYFTIPNEIR